METSRQDFGIAIRSAFLRKGTQQRFSLFALITLAVCLLFIEKIETKPLNYLRSAVKDIIYRGSAVVTFPSKGFGQIIDATESHINLFEENLKLKEEIAYLKNKSFNPDFLILENIQLRKLIDEQITSSNNLMSSRVIVDKQSPYLNSYILNSGANKKVKNGMAVLDGKNFIGRIVDVNFFSSRVLLVTDLNSKIPVIIEPTANHAILSGNGKAEPILDFLPKDHKIQSGNKIYTSGKEGIFSPGIPIGEVKISGSKTLASLFSDISQITFVNINLGEK